jgi:ribosomal protein S18 acetylase RimI-like enzyme
MSSSLPDGFDVRFATEADAGRVAELARASEHASIGVSVLTEGDILDWWRVTEPGQNVWLVESDGHLAASATLWPRGVPNVWGDVHPELLGRGLGTALLALAEARAGELGASAVRNDVFARDQGAISLLESRGYRPVRRYYEMRIDLGDAAPPEPTWPDGLTVAPFRDGDGPAFHEAFAEAFSEEWGATRMEYDEWRRARLEADDFEPELWSIVRDGDEIAAVARCDAYRYGGGWVAGLGVRKPWRKRGLGLALLQRTFRLFHERGERSVGLGVDSENPTGATRLYERAGMHVETETVTFEKTLS